MHRRLINILLVPFLAIASVLLLWLLLQQPFLLTESSRQVLPSITTLTPEVQTALAPRARATTSHTASIWVTKTVGADPHVCATSDAITVTAGTEVVYCYRVRNTGDITLTRHTVVDDKIGLLLDNKIITLTPNISSTAEAYFTAAVHINATTINTGTWIATNGAVISATDADTATVLVPTIHVTHTVGRDPHSCADTNTVNVPVGANVIHCYTVYNNGAVTLALHNAIDSRLGMIATAWPYLLKPGASINVTVTGVATETTTGVVTWTAQLSDTLYALAVADATIRVPAIRVHTTVGFNPHTCATSDVISVTVGTEITYCYLITNTGGVTLTRYDVYDMTPNQDYLGITHVLTAETSLLFTVTAPVTQAVVNTVTWTAYTTENFSATGRDSARVIALSKLDVLAFYDVNQKDGQNDLEPGVADVTVQLHTPNSETMSATTDQDGHATFMGLPSGVYTVSVPIEDLRGGYTVVTGQVLTLTAAGVYTTAFALTQSLETDSDNDGIPDWQEGAIDRDFDGVADYKDTTQMLYLAWVDH